MPKVFLMILESKNKISKSISHLVDTQMPLNWKQLTRLGLSIRPIDDKGRFDERGNQYEFGNELAGIAGLRRVEINPEKCIVLAEEVSELSALIKSEIEKQMHDLKNESNVEAKQKYLIAVSKIEALNSKYYEKI